MAEIESTEPLAKALNRRTRVPKEPEPPKVRDALDRFYTEDKLARLIAEVAASMAPGARTFLEPSSGGGSFLRAMRLTWGLQAGNAHRVHPDLGLPSEQLDPGAWAIHAVDIDPGAREPAERLSAQFFECPWLDFGTIRAPEADCGPPAPRMGLKRCDENGYDVILSNPPFASAPPLGRDKGEPIAALHVEHALSMLAVGGVMACLIRQSFLATQERAKLFRRFCPAVVDMLVERPSFTADGKTDQHEYCAIYWQRESRLLFRKPESTVLRWMSWK